MYLSPKKPDADGQSTNLLKEVGEERGRERRKEEGERRRRREERTREDRRGKERREKWTDNRMKHMLNLIHNEINLLSDRRVPAFDTYLSFCESLLLC